MIAFYAYNFDEELRLSTIGKALLGFVLEALFEERLATSLVISHTFVNFFGGIFGSKLFRYLLLPQHTMDRFGRTMFIVPSPHLLKVLRDRHGGKNPFQMLWLQVSFCSLHRFLSKTKNFTKSTLMMAFRNEHRLYHFCFFSTINSWA